MVLDSEVCSWNYGVEPHSLQEYLACWMYMVKSRSWTSPSHLAAAAGVSPVASARCQTSTLACLCTAGGEAASPRKEESDGGEDDAEEEEEEEVDGGAVLEVPWSVWEVVHCSFLEARYGEPHVRCAFSEVQRGETEQLPPSAAPH